MLRVARRRWRRRLVQRGRRGGLVDTAKLYAVRRDEGLSALRDEERSRAVGGDDAKATERVGDEPDKTACAASGMHALRGGCDVGLEVGEGAVLRGDYAGECVRALGVERLLGQCGLVVLSGGRWRFLNRCE